MPLFRGKAGTHTEFCAKLEIMGFDGFVFSEWLDSISFNEGTGLRQFLERYNERFGRYPESVIADKIYRNYANHKICKSLGIMISGPWLVGHWWMNMSYRKQKHLECLDSKIRNIVEGRFGTGTKKHRLKRMYTKRLEPTATVLILNLLVLSLEHLLRILYLLFQSSNHYGLYCFVTDSVKKVHLFSRPM